MTDARVILWGKDIAAVTWDDERELGVFQYAPEFLTSGIEVAPFMMPLQEGVFQFPSLTKETFRRLPGLIADSLPDKFGSLMIDSWLARQGRTPESFNPVERLCYLGDRGMGALEFLPTIGDHSSPDQILKVDELVKLANQVLAQRISLKGQLAGDNDDATMQAIIRVGTSAGGARAKAVLAWNEATGEFRSGQVASQAGFTQWLIKFDGVDNNQDKELADPQGYGLIEYAYHLMATEAGINMTRCRIHKEGGRSHFMTLRFDRTNDRTNDLGKLHMQSLCALMHYDFNIAGAHSYEQAIQAMMLLRLPADDIEQQFRRAVFNVLARNQDDHVKNIAFLMDRSGAWRLSPAFDVAYSYNPDGAWTSRHQMSINGKRDDFESADLIALAKTGRIKDRKALAIMGEVHQAVSHWQQHATRAGVPDDVAQKIENTFRLNIAR